MRQGWFWLLLACCPLLAWGEAPRPSSVEPRGEPHRSPIDLAVLPGGTRALSANHTADSLSLLDLTAGTVLAEHACGRKPAGVACSADGRRAAVSNLWSGTVTLFDVGERSLRRLAEVEVGAQPRGLVFTPDGGSLYIAASAADEIIHLDWATRQVRRRLPAPREPRRLALTRDGTRLLAACSRSTQVRCWDTRSGKLAWERTITDAFSLLGMGLSADDTQVVTAQVHHRHHPITKSNIEQGWALDNRLGMMPVRATEAGNAYSQIALDVRNKAVGDPSAVAFSPRGDWLAVAAAGTQELLLIQPAVVPWVAGEAGDFLDSSLDQGDGKLRRLSVGGRPLALQFAGENLLVANYLLDAVQVVDVKAGKVTRTIALGGPAQPSLARRGEAIFFDAKRSHHQWFSCHTCHTDGHTNGRTFDTLNDDSTNNPKMTPTLRGVARTGPWTWHGWQESLDDAVEKSLTETLWGPPPSRDDVRAVVAYMKTLDHPPNPHLGRDGKRSAAAERGKVLFDGKARCVRCHRGEEYTSAGLYDVKLPSDNSPFEKWNPPSLRGVHDRGPYLHDGSIDTLEELLRVIHAPEKLGGQPLTAEERRDVVAFLKTL